MISNIQDLNVNNLTKFNFCLFICLYTTLIECWGLVGPQGALTCL